MCNKNFDKLRCIARFPRRGSALFTRCEWARSRGIRPEDCPNLKEVDIPYGSTCHSYLMSTDPAVRAMMCPPCTNREIPTRRDRAPRSTQNQQTVSSRNSHQSRPQQSASLVGQPQTGPIQYQQPVPSEGNPYTGSAHQQSFYSGGPGQSGAGYQQPVPSGGNPYAGSAQNQRPVSDGAYQPGATDHNQPVYYEDFSRAGLPVDQRGTGFTVEQVQATMDAASYAAIADNFHGGSAPDQRRTALPENERRATIDAATWVASGLGRPRQSRH